jgi:hypothetical protein
VVKAIRDAAAGVMAGIAKLSGQIAAMVPEPGPALFPGCTVSTGASGLDPVAWVYDPLRCAAEWLLKPGDGMGERLSGLQAGLVGKFGGVGAIGEQWAGATSAWGAGCSCGGFRIEVPEAGYFPGWEGEALSSCSEPLSSWAAVTRSIGVIVLGIGALSTSLRFVMAAIGYIGPVSGDPVPWDGPVWR